MAPCRLRAAPAATPSGATPGRPWSAEAEQRPYTRPAGRACRDWSPAWRGSRRAERWTAECGRRATTLYAVSGPGVSRLECCVAAQSAGGAVDCGMRTPSNDPIRGRRAGRVATGVLRGGAVGGWSGGLRNADAEQRPYTRPAGRACCDWSPAWRRSGRVQRWTAECGRRATTLYAAGGPDRGGMPARWGTWLAKWTSPGMRAPRKDPARGQGIAAEGGHAGVRCERRCINPVQPEALRGTGAAGGSAAGARYRPARTVISVSQCLCGGPCLLADYQRPAAPASGRLSRRGCINRGQRDVEGVCGAEGRGVARAVPATTLCNVRLRVGLSGWLRRWGVWARPSPVALRAPTSPERERYDLRDAGNNPCNVRLRVGLSCWLRRWGVWARPSPVALRAPTSPERERCDLCDAGNNPCNVRLRVGLSRWLRRWGVWARPSPVALRAPTSPERERYDLRGAGNNPCNVRIWIQTPQAGRAMTHGRWRCRRDPPAHRVVIGAVSLGLRGCNTHGPSLLPARP